jgi:hypothetical protein
MSNNKDKTIEEMLEEVKRLRNQLNHLDNEQDVTLIEIINPIADKVTQDTKTKRLGMSMMMSKDDIQAGIALPKSALFSCPRVRSALYQAWDPCLALALHGTSAGFIKASDLQQIFALIFPLPWKSLLSADDFEYARNIVVLEAQSMQYDKRVYIRYLENINDKYAEHLTDRAVSKRSAFSADGIMKAVFDELHFRITPTPTIKVKEFVSKFKSTSNYWQRLNTELKSSADVISEIRRNYIQPLSASDARCMEDIIEDAIDAGEILTPGELNAARKELLQVTEPWYLSKLARDLVQAAMDMITTDKGMSFFPVARSGVQYATILSEALLAAGVEPGNILDLVEKAQKKVRLRVTKTMRKELKRISSGVNEIEKARKKARLRVTKTMRKEMKRISSGVNKIRTLPDKNFQTILTYLNLKEILYYALVDKDTKERTLMAFRGDNSISFDVNYNLIHHSEVLLHARSLVWLKPRLKSLKIHVARGDKYLIRILLNILGRRLEKLDIRHVPTVTFTRNWFPEAILRVFNSDNVVQFVDGSFIDRNEAQMKSAVKRYISSLFRSTSFHRDYDIEKIFPDNDMRFHLASCTEIREFCPNLKTFTTNTQFVARNLPPSLKHLNIYGVKGKIDLSSLPNLFSLSINSFGDDRRVNVTSPTVQELDLRLGGKQMYVTLPSLPNLKKILVKCPVYGFCYSTLPHLLIDNQLVISNEDFTRTALSRFPQNTPLPPERFRFSNNRAGSYDTRSNSYLYPDDVPKNCTVVVYVHTDDGTDHKVFSYSYEKGLNIFPAYGYDLAPGVHTEYTRNPESYPRCIEYS